MIADPAGERETSPVTPAPSLWRFFARTVGWFLISTLLWLQVSIWTSYPVAGIAHIVLGNGAKDWVRKVHKEPGLIQIDTRIPVKMPDATQEQGSAELVIDADPAHYAYGLPLLLALLLAAKSRHLIRRAVGGYLILLIPQSVSLIFELLRQIIVAGGSPAVLGVAQWQMEGIAIGYQVGSLLLPTLAPVAIWLWLDREFFAVIQGWAGQRSGNRRVA
jgi:hypothetical protein